MFLKAKGASDDFTTFVTRGVDIVAQSAADLVAKVARLCDPGSLQELVLYAHGANGSFSIGPDTIGGMSRDCDAALAKLAGLSSYFGGCGGRPRLILAICEAGRNPDNLVAMAKTVRQPVYACDGAVRPTLGIGLGWWGGNIIAAFPESDSTSTVRSIPAPPMLLS